MYQTAAAAGVLGISSWIVKLSYRSLLRVGRKVPGTSSAKSSRIRCTDITQVLLMSLAISTATKSTPTKIAKTCRVCIAYRAFLVRNLTWQFTGVSQRRRPPPMLLSLRLRQTLVMMVSVWI